VENHRYKAYYTKGGKSDFETRESTRETGKAMLLISG